MTYQHQSFDPAHSSIYRSHSPAALQVLVVEGNQDFQHVLCDMLETLGHQAIGVDCGEAALARLGARSFDAMIADINLPDMSGIDLARAAAKITPRIKIIFPTGFGYLLSERLDFDFVVLHKPYFLHQLAEALGRPEDKRPVN